MPDAPPRKTPPSCAILAAIRSSPGAYGREIIRATGVRSGVVYPALGRLEGRGYIAGRWEDPEITRAARRPARKHYWLTEAGGRLAAEWLGPGGC
jgi:DNA-binding PadR family transcriptional regulator